jgi:hypothetical protein
VTEYRCQRCSTGQLGLRRKQTFLPGELGMHRGETPEKGGGEGGRRVHCQAKQELCSSGTGVSLLGEQKSGGRKVSATDMHQGAGWVCVGVSSPALLPHKLRYTAYLTPPPSSQQRRIEREKERETQKRERERERERER